MTKRIKSGLIQLVSFLAVIVVTPEFGAVAGGFKDYLLEHKVSASLIALGTVIVTQIWYHLLNKYNLSKVKGKVAGSTAGSIDLY